MSTIVRPWWESPHSILTLGEDVFSGRLRDPDMVGIDVEFTVQMLQLDPTVVIGQHVVIPGTETNKTLTRSSKI